MACARISHMGSNVMLPPHTDGVLEVRYHVPEIEPLLPLGQRKRLPEVYFWEGETQARLGYRAFLPSGKRRCASCGWSLVLDTVVPDNNVVVVIPGGVLVCALCRRSRQWHLAYARADRPSLSYPERENLEQELRQEWKDFLQSIHKDGLQPPEQLQNWIRKDMNVNTTTTVTAAVTAATTPQGEKPKAQQPVQERLAAHGGLLASAAFDGVKLAGVNATSETILEIARRAAKNNPMLEAVLSDRDGRQLVIVALALVLHEVALEFPALVPKSNFVAVAARTQLTASTFILATNGMDRFKELLSDIGPLLAQMADAGEKLSPALPAPESAHASPHELEQVTR